MQTRLTYLIPLAVFICSSITVLIVSLHARTVASGNYVHYAKQKIAIKLNRLEKAAKQFDTKKGYSEIQRFFDTQVGLLDHVTVFLANPDGTVVASNNSKFIGRHGDTLQQTPSPGTVRHLKGAMRSWAQTAQDNNEIYGILRYCDSAKLPNHGPTDCGFLYYGENISARLSDYLNASRTQLVESIIGLALVSLALWVMLYYGFSQRLSKLIEAMRRFSAADHSVRFACHGDDEISAFGHEFDALCDTVVAEHNALVYSQAQLKAVFETAVDGIITIDAQGRVHSMNRSAENIFGYSREEVIGENVKILMPAPYKLEHDTYINNYLSTGQRKIIGIGREAVGQHKDGSIFPIELSVSEIEHKDKRSFTGIVRDISRRKHAEDQLKMREEELRLTLDNAPVGIVTCDSNYAILTGNRACSALLGYTEIELKNLRFTDLIHPEDRQTFMDSAQKANAGKTGVFHVVQRWVSKNGEVSRGRLHIGLVQNQNNDSKMFVLQMEDNTERLSAENEARQLRDRLAHVGRVSILGEMAAGIAHEINQPLTAIASYAEACQRLVAANMADSEELMHAMKQTSAQAYRAGEIIQRLRGFAKQHDVQRENVDVNDLIEDVVELAKLDTPNLSLPVRLKLAQDLPRIRADAVQIQQVLLNLIRNASDAISSDLGRNNPLLIRTTAPDKENIRIDVIDSGPGIDDADAKQIFNPFFSTKPSGMGLGLSICRSIVASHGGQLNFENIPAGGTCFFLTLPTLMG